ncbi:MAG: carbohydrate ABC transporter permease [Caldilineaceae bacterium]
MRRQQTISKILGFIIVGGGGLIMLMPFIWLLSSSFKSAAKIYVFPPQLIPDPFRWQNYVEVFSAVPVLTYARNTLTITVFSTIGTVLSSILAGYAFARLRFKGRDFIFSLLLATLMLPYVVIMIPVYVMFSKIGWVNTLLPLIVPSYFGDPFFIFLLRQFFRTIPMELEDAARIDGASRLRVLFQIMVPLARPAVIVVTIQSILGEWNAFMQPLIFLTKRNMWTLALGLNSLQRFETGRDWTHYMMVLGVFMVVPVVIMYFFAQREFIQGIVMTGLKG